MTPDEDIELRLVIARGLVSPAEAAEAQVAAARTGQRLLDRLYAEGVITKAVLVALRRAVTEESLPGAATVTGSARGRDPAMAANLATGDRLGPGADLAATLDGRLASNPAITGGRTTSSDSFPLPEWDRYEPIRMLGQGGMGRVYLARDLRLQREVAIKFMREDEPELARRIVAEARAQARVSDDRVCQVFDVGEAGGRVYIAMEFVDGQPLTELVDQLTYEQKALVIRGAALGIHEAHRVGLIHRDLKPSNIMVERAADGTLRPFVMDFGIARDWTDGSTVTGTVLGTPQFMAPEQARGEVKQLDRRADVYSLGATLYAFLTGKAPIEGDNQLVVLNRISLDAPPRPRTLDAGIPVDLEAIVMKCLEKDRADRYDSARALADDLGRFLDGAPVEARGTTSLGYRLRKAARRHWRPLVAAGVIAIVVAVALGFSIRERRAAGRRAQLARRFTERVERIEALARYAALSPAHDLRPDRAQITELMDQLAAEIRAGGEQVEGPGHYALGRGYLAFGDDDRALTALTRAWRRGFREPREAYALALAEVRRYQRGLRDLESLPAAEHAAARTELERQYRDPALARLRTLRGDEVAPAAYVAALIAFIEARFDDALADLDGIDLTAGGMSSFFEAPLLRGQVLWRRAVERSGRGDSAGVVADLAAGRAALARAATIADSDPTVHVAMAELEYSALAIELYGGGAVDEPYQRGLAATERALLLWPTSYDALVQRARFHRSLAEHRGRRGEDVTDLLTAARTDAQRAVDLDPDRAPGRSELVDAYRETGAVVQGQHRDPSAPLSQALTLLEQTPSAARSASYFVQLGLVHTHWADYQDEVGSAQTHRDLAIAAYEQALKLDERRSDAWLNLGKGYVRRATRHDSADADGDLARALTALARGGELDHDNVAGAVYLAEVHALVASRKDAQGLDPSSERAAAVAAYEAGLRISPDEPLCHNGVSMERAKQAADAWARGGDPAPLIAQAAAAAERAIAVAPEQGIGQNNLGDALAAAATYDLRRGRDPHGAARAALAAYGAALERIPEHPTILLNQALVHVILAESALDDGHDPTAELTTAKAVVDHMLVAGPDRDGLRARGAIATLEGRWLAQRGRPADDAFARAVAAYQQAIALAADQPDVGARELELVSTWYAWATARQRSGGDVETPVTAGLTLLDQLTAHRAAWPAAAVVRGGLLLVRARQAGATPTGVRDAQAAVAALDGALATNPNLSNRWGTIAADARRLAASR
ncbi:MAG: serine/threonine-protein kinase [Kofleriaceae bacterium]